MKYISLFLIFLVIATLIGLNLPLEDSLKKKSFNENYFRDGTSVALKMFMAGHSSPNIAQKDSVPKVELLIPGSKKEYPWGAQVRYSIYVSDVKDGDSKYGEINGNEVVLEVEYLPCTNEQEIKEIVKIPEKEPEPKGLILMKRSTCFGCHADKTKLGGPSFSEMAERYKKTFANIKYLAVKISEGSSGVWGNSTMPAHPDFTAKETEQIADYILEQGGRKNKWVLPGLEGTFRIIEKPDNSAKGIYVLTASYTAQRGVTGYQSVILKIE